MAFYVQSNLRQVSQLPHLKNHPSTFCEEWSGRLRRFHDGLNRLSAQLTTTTDFVPNDCS